MPRVRSSPEAEPGFGQSQALGRARLWAGPGFRHSSVSPSSVRHSWNSHIPRTMQPCRDLPRCQSHPSTSEPSRCLQSTPGTPHQSIFSAEYWTGGLAAAQCSLGEELSLWISFSCLSWSMCRSFSTKHGLGVFMKSLGSGDK